MSRTPNLQARTIAAHAAALGGLLMGNRRVDHYMKFLFRGDRADAQRRLMRRGSLARP